MHPTIPLTPPGSSGPTVYSILGDVYYIFTLVVPIIMLLALIYFFYGLAKYILSASSEDSKTEGRNIMIYGVIALFVMASVWGLVTFLQDTFGVNEGTAPVVTLPDVVR